MRRIDKFQSERSGPLTKARECEWNCGVMPDQSALKGCTIDPKHCDWEPEAKSDSEGGHTKEVIVTPRKKGNCRLKGIRRSRKLSEYRAVVLRVRKGLTWEKW